MVIRIIIHQKLGKLCGVKIILGNLRMNVKDRLKKLSQGLAPTDDWPWNPYKKFTVQAVIDHNPKYVNWSLEKGILLNNEAYTYLQEVLESQLENKNKTFDKLSDWGIDF
jgi:hypothetical protein